MTRFFFLFAAWATPAVIAGALGWSGIWGAGSAFGDYLIPVPVAGGVLHFPSFVVLSIVIFAVRRDGTTTRSLLPALAFAVAAGALAAMLDFDRLNGWLFTDYEPHGSPFRLEKNPLLLFITTDACWAGVYALASRRSSPVATWALVPLAAIVVIVVSALAYSAGGPKFKTGGAVPVQGRGNEMRIVFTSSTYDEGAFLAWLADGPMVAPWDSPNSEHVAVVFTNSLQTLKWRDYSQIEGNQTVATICLYEEDRSTVAYAGYHDCFAGRETAVETLKRLREEESTGLGSEVDNWYAMARLCDEVPAVEKPSQYIARPSMCEGMRRVFPKRLQQITDTYGEGSQQVRFIRAEALARGLLAE